MPWCRFTEGWPDAEIDVVGILMDLDWWMEDDWVSGAVESLYVCLIAEYVRKYATEEAIREQEKESSEKNQLSSDSESSMSDFSEDEARDMEL